MPHRGLSSPGLTGIELWSFVTDTAERVESVREGLRFAATPLRVIDHPPRENGIEWERRCLSRRGGAVGGGGRRAGGGGAARGRPPGEGVGGGGGGGGGPLRLMGYARSFRQMR